VAIDGGVDAALVLGSRSTDLLSGLGPPRLHEGDALALGDAGLPPQVDGAPAPALPGDATSLRVVPAPRSDWLTDEGTSLLTTAAYAVSPDSNRVAIRLAGPPLMRRPGELPSEGTVLGGIQVPADGQPLIFLADHPTTVGYPVVAIVSPDDLWQCAQLRPGATLRFTR
jgi:allophanate hydrolase subunit 2